MSHPSTYERIKTTVDEWLKLDFIVAHRCHQPFDRCGYILLYNVAAQVAAQMRRGAGESQAIRAAYEQQARGRDFGARLALAEKILDERYEEVHSMGYTTPAGQTWAVRDTRTLANYEYIVLDDVQLLLRGLRTMHYLANSSA